MLVWKPHLGCWVGGAGSVLRPAFVAFKRLRTHTPPPLLSRSGIRPFAAAVLNLGDLARKSQYHKVQDRLARIPYDRITVNEFETLCGEEGVREEDVLALREALTTSGTILHFPDSPDTALSSWIFTKPDKAIATILRALDVKGERAAQEHAALTRKIFELMTEVHTLESKVQGAERHALRKADRWLIGGGLFLLAQFGVFVRMTWWEFSWDVMEPITYFVGLGTAVLCHFYFLLTKSEYTLEDIRGRLTHRQLSKAAIDLSEIERLRAEIRVCEGQLRTLRTPAVDVPEPEP